MTVACLPGGTSVCLLASAFGVEAFGMNIGGGAPALVARPRTPRSSFRRQIKQMAFAILLVAVLPLDECEEEVRGYGLTPFPDACSSTLKDRADARRKSGCQWWGLTRVRVQTSIHPLHCFYTRTLVPPWSLGRLETRFCWFDSACDNWLFVYHSCPQAYGESSD